MSLETIYPPTSVKISIAVTIQATGAYVDPTTLALVISASSGTVTTKAIADLTHDGTGLYSYVHRFPSDAPSGIAYIKATADAAIDATAVTNVERLKIEAIPTVVA